MVNFKIISAVIAVIGTFITYNSQIAFTVPLWDRKLLGAPAPAPAPVPAPGPRNSEWQSATEIPTGIPVEATTIKPVEPPTLVKLDMAPRKTFSNLDIAIEIISDNLFADPLSSSRLDDIIFGCGLGIIMILDLVMILGFLDPVADQQDEGVTLLKNQLAEQSALVKDMRANYAAACQALHQEVQLLKEKHRRELEAQAREARVNSQQQQAEITRLGSELEDAEHRVVTARYSADERVFPLEEKLRRLEREAETLRRTSQQEAERADLASWEKTELGVASQAIIAGLGKDLEEATEKNAAVAEELSRSQEESKRVKGALRAKIEMGVASQAEIAGLGKALEEAVEKNNAVSEELSKAQREAESLKRTAQEEGQRADLASEAEAKTEAASEAEITSLSKRLEEALEKNAAMAKELKEAQEQAKQDRLLGWAESEAKTITQDENVGLRSKLQEALEKNTTISKELSEAQAQASTATKDLEEAKEASAEQWSAWQQAKNRAEKAEQDLMKEREEAQKALADRDQTISELKQQTDAARAKEAHKDVPNFQARPSSVVAQEMREKLMLSALGISTPAPGPDPATPTPSVAPRTQKVPAVVVTPSSPGGNTSTTAAGNAPAPPTGIGNTVGGLRVIPSRRKPANPMVVKKPLKKK